MKPRILLTTLVLPPLFLLPVGGEIEGQGVIPPDPGWAPLGPEARSARGAAAAECAFCLSVAPRWGPGSFASGRNPAGAAFEVTKYHAGFGFGRRSVGGDYRSVLDPESVDETVATALGRRPLGENRGGLVGQATYGTGSAGRNGRTVAVNPGTGFPYTVADTTLSAASSRRARLDAAGGWRRGRVGVGLGVSYEAVEARAVPSRTPRMSRAAMPAASLGTAVTFADESLQLGTYVRMSGSRVTTQIIGAPGVTIVTRANGYAPPVVRLLAEGLPGGPLHYDRSEANTRAGGLTVVGQWGHWSMGAWSEIGSTEELGWTRQDADPPRDRWETRGWDAGAELRGDFGDTRLFASVRGGGFHGTARPADSNSIIYRAAESAVAARVEGSRRLGRGESAVMVALRVESDDRDRGDTIPNALRTEIRSLSTGAEVEARFEARPGVLLVAGYQITRYQPRGSLPDSGSFPAPIRDILTIETGLMATPTLGHVRSMGVQWAFRPGTALQVVATHQTLDSNQDRFTVADWPDGNWGGWSMGVGMVLR